MQLCSVSLKGFVRRPPKFFVYYQYLFLIQYINFLYVVVFRLYIINSIEILG